MKDIDSMRQTHQGLRDWKIKDYPIKFSPNCFHELFRNLEIIMEIIQDDL